jgi:hypothetical protein
LNGCSIEAELGVIVGGGYINARGGTVVGEAGTVSFGAVKGRTVGKCGWKGAEGSRVSGESSDEYGLRGVVSDVVDNPDLLKVHVQVER